jgi:4-hydroxy-L-threonine phosphate dehydrogenase PdxA
LVGEQKGRILCPDQSVKVLVTTGDVDGIGLEVAIKALLKVGPQPRCQIIVWLSNRIPKAKLKTLSKKFKIIWAQNLDEALRLPILAKNLILIHSPLSPALWVEQSAKACFEKRADSMVTGPLSKQEIRAAGLLDIGHTDILKRISGSKTAFMGFLGKYFNVVLATGHVPLRQVEQSLSTELLTAAIVAAKTAQGYVRSKKPIGVLGLNPHAGDGGLIGDFDNRVTLPVVKSTKAIGPLVADAAFVSANWKKYSFYVALYHDQGLIPFKALHGYDSGVHLTLGLPIKRSSVDHGTAKDIYGKNKANAGSMTEALRWGIRLAKQKES